MTIIEHHKERRVAVMFTDIRGFSRLTRLLHGRRVYFAEGPKSGHIVTIGDVLKTYLEPVCKCIYNHGGIVDKFTGDGVMAFFRESEQGFDCTPAVRSVQTALAVQECFNCLVLAQWNKEWLLAYLKDSSEDYITPALGIGLTYGEAEFARFYGRREGPSSTVVGDTVNLAARLEKRAGKEYPFPDGPMRLSPILASQPLFNHVGPAAQEIQYEEYGAIKLEGLDPPQRAVGILGRSSPHSQRWSQTESPGGDSRSSEQIVIGQMMVVCGKAGQIYRPVLMSDYGIDGEIEFKDKIGPSGRKVYVQLKGGSSQLRRRKADGKEIFDVKNPYHLDYWVNQPVDVHLVISDAQRKMRWMNVTGYLRKRSDKHSRQIIFEGEELDVAAVLRLKAKILRNRANGPAG